MYLLLRWSSSKGLLPSSSGHSGQLISYGRSTASTPTKYVTSSPVYTHLIIQLMQPGDNFGLVQTKMCFPWLHLLMSQTSVGFFSRIVQSLTWCLKMLSTSGLLVQQEKSAPSSRFFTTLVSATAQHENPSSSTVTPNCWGVRFFGITQLTAPFFSVQNTVALWYCTTLTAVTCYNPVWLSMTTTNTWYTWKCMHIPHAQRLFSTLLTLRMSSKMYQQWLIASDQLV